MSLDQPMTLGIAWPITRWGGFVYDYLDEFGRRRQGLMCNPQIVLAGDPQMNADLEGCLSLLGAYLPVSLPDVAICHREDQFGEPIKHLNGIVMEEHLTAAERRDLRRQHTRGTTYYPEDWPT
jgi:peptide deformylase